RLWVACLPGHLQCGVDSTRNKSRRNKGMDESLTPVKTVKQSQLRGAKALSTEKSNKETLVQREGHKSASRSKENSTTAKDEHNIGSQVSRGQGKTSTDTPQDKRRGRPSRLSRLTGRTGSGERGKGKGASLQQHLVPQASESRTSLSADKGPEVRPTVEEGPLTEQQLGLRQAEERLRRDYIYRLLKSPEYPNYQYICKLCSVHIENIQGAHKHIKEKRHKKNIMEKQEENELRALPPPSAAQLWAVNAAVLETARQQGISDEDFEIRKTVVSRMEIIIQKHLTACSLRLYGSCLTRFAFKTSDINIDVTYPPSMTQPEVLIQVLEILKNSQFGPANCHLPPPLFLHSGLMCKVSAGNDVACLTTNHLAALSKLEPRLISLVLAFRYWARLCHIDCQAEGGIPSYSFALMVIFFLQQRKDPILPVYLGPWFLNEIDSVDTLAFAPGLCTNHSCFHLKIRLTFNVGKDVALGQLWLELLRFYTLEFALEEYIISIRLKDLLSREVKNWPRRRLAIEDPFALKRNVARSLNSQMVFEYIQERFRTAYKYFACPQKKGTGGHQTKKKARAQGVKLEEAGKKEPSSTNKDENNIKAEKSQSVQRGHQGSKEDEEPDSDDEDGSDPSKERNESTLDTRLMDMLLSEGNTLSSSPNGLLDSDREEEEEEEDNGVSEDDGPVAPDDLHYVFDKMIFTCGKPPTVVCSICKRDGHLKDECPEDFKKIELKPLPPMNDRFREILDGLCKLCYYELSPTHAEQQRREQILASLERFIRKEYNEKAQLCLFGSSKNGFGFRDSDLDICMTLEGHETAEKLNCKEIIEGLAKVLKKHTGLRNILPITTAKVPIVKFEHKQSGLEGDISLYNTLAQHNTRMLATYAALDPRVQFLGYTMKVFAKRCDIGDASRGSLSSYAYILMVLYFLQQRQPPVIPVLQEIFDGNTVPQRLVDGWNAFFFDDLEDLVSWKNKRSVGELWLGLLRFYTEEFDFKEHVISIRQRKRLTTFEKQWTSKCIAIEDPFDLNHNLGAGVSRKMTNFIMKAFINGRKLFGTPFYPEYFFDSKVLTDGELAPNDRCCRICGKIGHYMKDCPKRRRWSPLKSQRFISQLARFLRKKSICSNTKNFSQKRGDHCSGYLTRKAGSLTTKCKEESGGSRLLHSTVQYRI
uniref:CCHC-type domain-containing protein n=1 Tax=Astatotilapia calliptera TaxID=8154 RepID=A0AAX7V9H2_ASTCA